MALGPGDRVDRYILKSRLGQGGQGEVWRAEDPLAPAEDRAIKLVPVASASPTQLERVRREARQLVQLEHPSLVPCHGMFEDLHSQLLGIVMDFVDADPIRALVADSRLTSEMRLFLLAHIAGALAYVHQRGVVHRDVKLDNVLVTQAFRQSPASPSTVKLIDFGIAVESTNPKPLTKIGSVIGTPAYFAPEQLEPEVWGGGSASRASPASDVFAFGVLAWKLLARDADAHPASVRSGAGLGDYAAAYRRAAGAVFPPEAPDPSWAGVLAGALALHPSSRIATGLDLIRSLSSVAPHLVLPTAEATAPTPRPATASSPDDRTEKDATFIPSHGTATEPNVSPGAPSGAAALRTVPGAPPAAVFTGTTRPTPPKGGRAGLGFAFGFGAAVLMIGLVAVGVIAVYLVLVQPNTEEPPRVTAPAVPTAQATELAPSPAPEAIATNKTEATDVTCTDCRNPGTRCEAGTCRLASEKTWRFRPFAVMRSEHNFENYPAHRVCSRLSGQREADWVCADATRKPALRHDGSFYYFTTSVPHREVTRDQLEVSGIDVKVLENGAEVAQLLGYRHPTIVAGDKLFRGGLTYDLSKAQVRKHDRIRRVFFQLELVGP